MSPLYEYRCPQCKTEFEEIRSMAQGRYARCPECNRKSYKVMSLSTFKSHNPFTKDGEGFSSVNYHPQEARERIKSNAGKYD